ncbi:helix-turn-helix DNA binding domain protein [Arthrobacter phage Lizalica]|uniref:DNA binding protein n=1 Tax=Arthrobacter phage Lizalica TaxID=2832319 RepID=A0AA48Y4F2_9CAUD|nr:helix-turn-helix DNA binding domain protein [Arthrobacter phage Lizalica]UIW13528.1 DNA binding protein [Arthrobacter phage Lizalica]
MPARLQVDRAEFARLHAEGRTIPELAEHFGISPRSVGNLRRELGLRSGQFLTPARLARIEAMLDDGWSFKEIHRTEGADMETLRRHFPGRQWSKAEAIAHTAALRYFGEQINKAAYATPSKGHR